MLTQSERKLQLEVVINGESTRHFMDATLDPKSGKLFATRRELTEAGVRAPTEGAADQPLALDDLGYAMRFEEAHQRLHFTLDDAQREAKDYLASQTQRAGPPRADPGFLLNYSLFAASYRDANTGLQFSGANASLDARAFSNYGVLSQTAIIGSTLYREGPNVLRLESTYTFSHADSAISGRAGDFISSGLNWTRPIRMGGVQVQRDFTLRADIVTRPIPVVAGSAAAPSTVDVYINGTRAYSQDVGAGPFRISNLPLMSGSGDARVVVRDASGRQTETTMPLVNTIRLLRPGITDFSIEGGYARRNFGILSQDYDNRPLASATLRRGLTPWLTVEAHAEGGAGLVNGGAGFNVSAGVFGTLSVAGAFSRQNGQAGGRQGYQIYGGWEAQYSWLNISAATQRTFSSYRDLAAATAKYEPQVTALLTPIGLLSPIATQSSTQPYRALDRISLSAPLRFDAGFVSASFIHSQRGDGLRNKMVTLSYSRPLPYQANIFVTAFADFGSVRNQGLFAGLTVPIMPGIYATSGVTHTPNAGTGASFELSKPQPQSDNTYGWRVRDVEGRTSQRMAQASYRSSYGQVGGQVQQAGDRLEGNLTYDGSIAVMGGGVFAGNKVMSSFAVVDAGRPDVPVLQDNREIGRTNRFGKKMISDLRPYDANRIAIDPSQLPANYDVSETHAQIVPHARAGVFVNFARHVSTNAASVTFIDSAGQPMRPGLRGTLAGSGEDFVVGYDGAAYLRGLSAANDVTIQLEQGECRASFAFSPTAGRPAAIERVTCR